MGTTGFLPKTAQSAAKVLVRSAKQLAQVLRETQTFTFGNPNSKKIKDTTEEVSTDFPKKVGDLTPNTFRSLVKQRG